MQLKWILLFLTIMSVNAQSGQLAIEIIEQFDDSKVVAFIGEDDIENYPIWQKLENVPPLPVNEAVKLVQYHLNGGGQGVNSSVVKEIEIREIPRHPGYWHYLVKIKNNDAEGGKYRVFVVLMNGKLIPAIVEPDSFK